MGAGLLNGSLSAAFVPLVLRLWTVFFPVQTQFAGARSLWSVLQEKTACAARATASDKARTRFQCLCSEKRGDTSAIYPYPNILPGARRAQQIVDKKAG
jgi:hypothetical protein